MWRLAWDAHGELEARPAEERVAHRELVQPMPRAHLQHEPGAVR